MAGRPSRTTIGLGWSAPQFGGSGPCIMKVEQHFHFAILDKWIELFFKYYLIKIFKLFLL
jgi:hypothetical protein